MKKIESLLKVFLLLSLLMLPYFNFSQVTEEYWPNGKLKIKSNKKGYYVRYYENGQVERKDTIVDKNWDITVGYYPNGKLKGSNYVDKTMKGLERNSVSYFENGKISQQKICDSLFRVIYEVNFYGNGKKETEYFRKGDSTKYLSYFNNGQLQKSDELFKGNRIGEYLEYYENGQQLQKITFEKGYPVGEHIVYYDNGLIEEQQTFFFMIGRHLNKIPPEFGGETPYDGKYYRGYKSGAIAKEGSYNKGKKVGFWAEYDEYENNIPIRKNQRGPLLWSENYDSDGKRDGIWIDTRKHVQKTYVHDYLTEEIVFDENGKIKNKTTYDLPSDESKNTNSQIDSKINQNEKEEIFTTVEEMPEFPGGSMEMMKYIQKNLEFPTTAKEAGITGKCFLKFVVKSDGSIGQIQVLKGVAGCPDCDQEAKRIVESMPKWKAGKQNGRLVSTYFNLPIYFTSK